MAAVDTQMGDADAGYIGGYPPDYVPTVKPGSRIEASANEAVAWAAESLQPTYLDQVAKIIFDVIDGRATVADLAADIEDVFEVDREVAVWQLSRVLQLLDEGRLISNPTLSDSISGDLRSSVLPDPDH